jgi:hypothetical protein
VDEDPVHRRETGDVTVGEEYLWAIDTRGIIRFCELPCDDGQWRRPSGVPAGITYIDASKFVSRV